MRLEVGRGRLARSSYGVSVRHHALPDVLTLTPCTPHSSRLVRGRRHRGRNELATLTRGAEGDVGLVWSTRSGAPEPLALEAALGYLLAAAFDTGGELAVVRLVTEGADLLFPG